MSYQQPGIVDMLDGDSHAVAELFDRWCKADFLEIVTLTVYSAESINFSIRKILEADDDFSVVIDSDHDVRPLDRLTHSTPPTVWDVPTAQSLDRYELIFIFLH